MSYQFKVGDKGKTRCGEPYRIICTDRNHDVYSMIVLVGSNKERVENYTSIGSYVERQPCSDHDLLPPTVTKYLNVWIQKGSRSTTSQVYESLNKAELHIDSRTDVQWIIKAQPIEVQES